MGEVAVGTEPRLGRAAREEVWWALGHLINMEEHLFESGLSDQAAVVRDARRHLAVEWGRAEGFDDGLFRRDWCVYKHAFSLLVHLQEVAVSAAAERPELAVAAWEAFRAIKDLLHLLTEYHRQGGGGG